MRHYAPGLTIPMMAVVVIGMGVFSWQVLTWKKPVQIHRDNDIVCTMGGPVKRVQNLIAIISLPNQKKSNLAVKRLGTMGSDAEVALPHLRKVEMNHPDREVREYARESIRQIEMSLAEASQLSD